MKKITFFLMNKKGLQVLNSLIRNNMLNSIKCVIGSEDKSIIKDYFDEIKGLCRLENIIFYDRKDNLELSNSFKLAIGWRWLINESTNLIVFHDSLLPKYRGFAPLVNCLINKEKRIGVTALIASKEYDKGDIIAQKSLSIIYPKRIEDAIDEISILYSELVLDIIDKINRSEYLIGIKQNEEEASYSLWRDEEDYFINWKWDSKRIKRFIDAVGFPYKGAKTYINGTKFIILNAKSIEDVVIENRDIGKVIFFNNTNPVVVCGTGLIEIIDIRDKDMQEYKLNKFRSRFH